MRVPDGWMIERMVNDDDYAILCWPPHGNMTVDFAGRCFRLGISTVGRIDGPKKRPTGRGWSQRLVDEAVARLREINSSPA